MYNVLSQLFHLAITKNLVAWTEQTSTHTVSQIKKLRGIITSALWFQNEPLLHFLHSQICSQERLSYLSLTPQGSVWQKRVFPVLSVSSKADIFCSISCDRAHCASQKVKHPVSIWADKWGCNSYPHGAHNLLMETKHRKWLKNWSIEGHGVLKAQEKLHF